MGVCPFFVGGWKVFRTAVRRSVRLTRPRTEMTAATGWQLDGKEGVNRKETDIERLLAPVVALEGCEIWGVEYRAQGRHSKLSIYIDGPEGVGVDDCERVSRRVSDVLDVEDVLSGAYTLEVSSPGMDRILFKPQQYERCVGEEIDVRLNYPVDGTKRIKGVLMGLESGEVVVRHGEDEYLLPLENVQRARIVPRFD